MAYVAPELKLIGSASGVVLGHPTGVLSEGMGSFDQLASVESEW